MEYIPAKTIVSGYMREGWFASNYNMNLYKGCCHGCIYCDSRSNCYQIENFDTVRAKANALQVVENDLRKKRKKGVVITGSMSDPYNPMEEQLELTRGALQIIQRYGFGAAIDTKSDLVVRDIDVLQAIQKYMPVTVSFTITAARDDLCAKIEQTVCPSSKRFEAMRKLSQAGIPTGVLLMPVLPYITDTEENIRALIEEAHACGAKWIFAFEHGLGVTLRENQRLHYFEKLDEQFPGLRQKYINQFGMQYECETPNYKALWALITTLCKQLNLHYDMRQISAYLKQPYETQQMRLI